MSLSNCRESLAKSSWWVLFGMLLLVGLMCSTIPAQEGAEGDSPAEPAAKAADAAAPAAGEAAPEGGTESQSMLMWLIETSGLIGGVILVISIFFVHRVVTLFMEMRPEVVAPPELVEQIDGLLAKRDFNGIYQASKKSETALGQLLVAGMTAMSSGVSEAREAMDRTGEAITVHMEKRISLLAVIGSLGPMIGLLGTLKGMIGAFSGIALSGTQLKASEVAGNISEALVLTFEGVAVSVPAIYFYAFFKDRVSTLSVDVQNLSDEYIRKFHAAAQRPVQASS
jgi:biopolymer transport protein ExbB